MSSGAVRSWTRLTAGSPALIIRSVYYFDKPTVWTDGEKRQQLINGEPLHFPPWPAEGKESQKDTEARTIKAEWLAELAAKAERIVKVPIDLQNGLIQGDLDLRYATFDYEVAITDSVFDNKVDLSYCIFKRNLTLCRSIFRQGADLRSGFLPYDALLCKTKFLNGKLNCLDLRIDGVLRAPGAEFGDGVEANFNRASFAKSAFFEGSIFGGDVDFGSAHIGSAAVFDGTVFKQKARFDRVHIDGNAFFRRLQKEKGTVEDMLVVFKGDAHFNGAHIQGVAHFDRAGFEAGAEFDNAQFGAPAVFDSAEFGQVNKQGETQVQKATFIGARFERGAYFKAAQFRGKADFTAAVSDRDALFMAAVFEDAVTFRESRFQSAQFRDALIRNSPAGEKPQFRKKVDLHGFTYDRIYVAWEDLLKLTEYDRQPYAQLEKALRSTGLDREADAVYYEQRRRAGSNIRPRRLLSWLWDRTYRYLAGYGVRVWPLVLAPILLVGLGAFVFQRQGALAEKPETTAHAKPSPTAASALSPCLNKPSLFDGFSVSLRLLIRLEVPSASKCLPSENVIAAWLPIRYSTYGTLHMLIGWLLVPFAVASIAARLSRRVST